MVFAILQAFQLQRQSRAQKSTRRATRRAEIRVRVVSLYPFLLDEKPFPRSQSISNLFERRGVFFLLSFLRNPTHTRLGPRRRRSTKNTLCSSFSTYFSLSTLTNSFLPFSSPFALSPPSFSPFFRPYPRTLFIERMSSSGYQLLMSKLPQRRPALNRLVSFPSFVSLRFSSLFSFAPFFFFFFSLTLCSLLNAICADPLWWSLVRVPPPAGSVAEPACG